MPKQKKQKTVPEKSHAEIRENYIHNRTVIIAPGRSKRPHNFKPHIAPHINKKESPFSPEKINNVNALLTVGGRDWKVKVIKNIFPVVDKTNEDVYGQQEVVIETPDDEVELAELPVSHIKTGLKVFA
ncbi:MAG: hypothetical protein Q8Q20_02110, partial [bacterium]|nr:hypothetical protein [bacterium]